MFSLRTAARPLAPRLANIRTYATETVVVPGILATAPASSSSAAAPTRKPYHVSRTASQNLPVYLAKDRASKTYTTVVRRVDGDARVLKTELQEALKVPAESVKLNPVTNHVHIKGQHMERIKTWIAEQGF